MSTSAPPKKNEWDTDENHFKRWDWIMVEMIFAFECKLDDTWQEKFSSGEFDKLSVTVDHLGNEVPKRMQNFFSGQTDLTTPINVTTKACEWSSKGFIMVLDFLVVITKTSGTENRATACN